MINLLFFAAVLISTPMTLERVVAVVGEEPILNSDVVSILIESGIDEETAFTIDPSAASYRLAMDQIIEEKLLVEAARREGIYPEREEIQAAVDENITEFRSGFYSEQEFISYLAAAGMTITALRDSYSVQLADKIASESYVRAKAGTAMSAMPSDPVLFFNENQETVREVLAPMKLSWIYIPVLPSDTDEAEGILAEVRTQVESGEMTFSAAAASYSQDGTAATGGDLGWFGRGDMAGSFEKVVYDLEPGQIAGPFLTPFGVHLVKLTDRNQEDDTVRASHIILINQLTPEDLSNTMLVADGLAADLEAGMNFAEAVHNYSSDPDPSHLEGYLGTVNVGVWEGEMRNAVIDLAPGEISSPVAIEQNMAVAVFRVNEDQSIDWEEFTTEELNSMLQSVYWQNYYSAMIESLKEEIPFVVNI